MANDKIVATGNYNRIIRDIDKVTTEQLTDWGPQPDCNEGQQSYSRGILLHKGPDNKPESGFWECTPGRWRLSIPRDEFCHFIAGEATYTSDTGEVTEVKADTCVLFSAGWSGTCVVHSTVRNVYMLTA